MGRDLDTVIETLAKELGDRQSATAPQVAPEVQRPVQVAGRKQRREQQPRARIVRIRPSGLTQKGVGREKAGNERAYDEESRSLAADDEVVLEMLNLASCVVADRNVDNEADEDRDRVDIHPPLPAPSVTAF
jgi:hypothetical protein